MYNLAYFIETNTKIIITTKFVLVYLNASKTLDLQFQSISYNSHLIQKLLKDISELFADNDQ